MKLGIHIFTRDFDLIDNLTLLELSKKCDKIIPLFVFENHYKNKHFLKFLLETINDFEIKMIIKKGDKVNALCQVIADYEKSNNEIVAISISRDYGNLKLENKLKSFCNKSDIEFLAIDNLLLLKHDVLNAQGNIYKVFTPFYNKVQAFDIKPPMKKVEYNFVKIKNNNNIGHSNYNFDIKNISNGLNNNFDIDIISNGLNSKIASYLNLGIISVRVLYKHANSKIKNDEKREAFCRQLIFREFFYNIAKHYPEYIENLWEKGFHNYKRDLDWEKGNTDYEIVNILMKKLNETGYINNRARMIVANYLLNHSARHWSVGANYFETVLIDYDKILNIFGWIWGVDVELNLDIQSRKFLKNYKENN